MLKFLPAILIVLFIAPAWADVESGETAFRAADYQGAMKQFAPAAKAGDREAQYWLGRMHDAGLGVARDRGKAMAWFERAASQGHAETMRILGVYFETG